MLLTPAQIFEIQEIIKDYHDAFIINAMGEKALAPEVVQRLKDKGLIDPQVNSIEDAYLYGQVLAALESKQAADMSFGQFKEHVKKNPIPLSDAERQAIQMAALHAGQYCRGLGNKIGAEVGNDLIEADAKLRARMETDIRTTTAENIAKRETVKQLKTDLGWKTRDWARDLDRIAVTEKQTAMQEGVADGMKKEHGDPLVAKIPQPDACKHCIRLYLVGGDPTNPRIFKLSTLEGNGTNVGLKTADWKAVVGTVHPHCQCQLVRVPKGWGFDETGTLMPGATGGTRYDSEKEITKAIEGEILEEITREVGSGGMRFVLPTANALIKAGQVGGKYIRRVPYTDKHGKKKYRYYYAESSIARDVQAGEDIRIGGDLIKVEKVSPNGTIHLRSRDQKLTIKPNQWSTFVSAFYGEAYHAHAEKRALQSVNAVLRHVPIKLLSELSGKTDKERLEDLKKRVPDVYAKLQKSFQRAGVNPYRAKQVIGAALERKGWEPKARAAVIGDVITDRNQDYRSTIRAAENLSGGKLVKLRHVAAVTELKKEFLEVPKPKKRKQKRKATPRKEKAESGSPLQTLVAKAEKEIASLAKLLEQAKEGVAEDSAATLQAALSAEAIHKLNMIAQAFPGLADKAVEPAREIMEQVPSAAPTGEPKALGAATSVFVAGDGGQAKRLSAKYKLVEADQAIASHDPRSFNQRKDYPGGIQERAYHRDKEEQAKVQRNAQRLLPEMVVNTNPDAVNGPPIMSADGVVLGGNSRTMSIQLAYAKHPEVAAKLKAYLAEHAHEAGFTQEDVAQFKNPVLVRVVDEGGTTKEDKQLLVRQMNESFTQDMDPRTMQVALGRKLTDQTVNSLANAMKPDETLNAFLSTKRSDAFMSELRKAGVIDQRNANRYIDQKTGKPNADGKTLVARVLVGRTIGDADLLSATKPSIIENLARSVPYMVQATSYGKGYDLGGDLKTAIDAYNSLQYRVDTGTMPALKADMPAEMFDRLFSQQEMFGEAHPVADNPKAMSLLEVLIRRPGSTQISNVFKDYAEQAKQNPEGQGGLLGAPKTPTQSLTEVVQRHLQVKTKPKEKQQQQAAALFRSVDHVLPLRQPSYALDNLRKAGPFIGPRGGKWADSKHTIPWKKPVKKALFHSAPAHAMESIQENGLVPRQGAGTFSHGVYGTHSQGKVFLSEHHDAAREWHDKVENMLFDAHDDTSKHKAVMLRVKHRKTEVDEVGNKDIEGSRQYKKKIPPEHLEFYDKEHGWRPIAKWSPGREKTPSEEVAHHPGNESERILAKRKQRKAEAVEREKARQQQQQDREQAIEAARLDWEKKGVEAREKEAARLLSLKTPIPGYSALGPIQQRELGVDAKGKVLQKSSGPFIGPKGGKWADPEHTIPWKEGGEAVPKKQEDDPKKKPKKEPEGEKPKKPKKAPPGSQLPEETFKKLLELKVSKLPQADIPAESIRVDLEGDVDSKAIIVWPDKRGSMQSGYTPAFHARNAAAKWKRVTSFREQVPQTLKTFEEKLNTLEKGSMDHQGALLGAIIARTGLRPGSVKSAKAHQHYGIVTLQPEHVSVVDDKVSFDYIGKSGKRNTATIQDETIAKHMQAYLEGKKEGESIFQSDRVIKAANKFIPKGMKLKDFRTIKATETAARLLEAIPEPPPLTGKKAKDKLLLARAIKEVSTRVAEVLNNTPSVARESYIHPEVIKYWALSKAGADKSLLDEV